MNPYEELGKEVVSTETKLLAHQEDLSKSRGAFLQQAELITSSTSRTFNSRVLVPSLAGAALLSAAALILFVVFSKQDGVIEFSEIGADATSEADRSFRFPRGSSVAFSANTLGKITTDNEEKVQVKIENGDARIRVVHQKETQWTVTAGPYRIHVIGTAFTVKWIQQTQQFRLDLQEGEVLVEGPMMTNGQKITAGQTMVADVSNERLELSRSHASRTPSQETPVADHNPIEEQAPSDDTMKSVHSHSLENSGPKPSHPSPVRRQKPKPNPTEDGDWLPLAKKGKYKEAFDHVAEENIDSVVKTGDAEHMLLLADTARWNSKLNLAESIYLKLRQRYPKSSFATIAALQLGRMEFDQRRRYDKASFWLETYLAERTGSTLERETLGRLMEAQKRAGKIDNAKKTAKRYLLQSPNGPHAKRAQDLMAQ